MYFKHEILYSIEFASTPLKDKVETSGLKDSIEKRFLASALDKQSLRSMGWKPNTDAFDTVLSAFETFDPSKEKTVSYWYAKIYAQGGLNLAQLNEAKELVTKYQTKSASKTLEKQYASLSNINSLDELKKAVGVKVTKEIAELSGDLTEKQATLINDIVDKIEVKTKTPASNVSVTKKGSYLGVSLELNNKLSIDINDLEGFVKTFSVEADVKEPSLTINVVGDKLTLLFLVKDPEGKGSPEKASVYNTWSKKAEIAAELNVDELDEKTRRHITNTIEKVFDTFSKTPEIIHLKEQGDFYFATVAFKNNDVYVEDLSKFAKNLKSNGVEQSLKLWVQDGRIVIDIAISQDSDNEDYWPEEDYESEEAAVAMSDLGKETFDRLDEKTKEQLNRKLEEFFDEFSSTPEVIYVNKFYDLGYAITVRFKRKVVSIEDIVKYASTFRGSKYRYLTIRMENGRLVMVFFLSNKSIKTKIEKADLISDPTIKVASFERALRNSTLVSGFKLLKHTDNTYTYGMKTCSLDGDDLLQIGKSVKQLGGDLSFSFKNSQLIATLTID